MAPHKILIADDDRQLLDLLSGCLRRAGYDVITAQDSLLAMQMAHKHQPDLMLLDVHMPAGDGFSIQTRFRNTTDDPDTPVIYLTGEHSEEIRLRAHGMGALAVLHKPLSMETVVAAVRTGLGCKTANTRVPT